MGRVMIIRLFRGEALTGWKYRLANWLRWVAFRMDDGHAIVIGTENPEILKECAERCIEAVSYEMASDDWRENARGDHGRFFLTNWQPFGERMQ